MMLALTKRPLLRSLLLGTLLLLSIGCYFVLSTFAAPNNAYEKPFLYIWIVSFLPYLMACLLVLTTRVEAVQQRWQLIELAIILIGALLFRVMLLPQVPWLSRDSWRYLWDARVFLHGYSPYVYPPDSAVLKPLRDALIYGHSGYLYVPTVYPPVAEYVYIISYLLAPSNLFFLKTLFVMMDMVSCIILAFMLVRRGLDPRRIILYAWCPLPIIEFAIEGHVDALTIMLVALVLLVATSPHCEKRSVRILLGFLIALATLTKIYPLLLLAAVIRRRDYALLIVCFGTIILAYVPFLIVGHGQVLGFFSTYATEQRQNAGIVPLIVHWITYTRLHLQDSLTVLVQYIVDVVLVVPTIGWLLFLRMREKIGVEAAMLALIGVVYAVSTHIFPWYTPSLLFFVPLLVGPLWRREQGKVRVAAKRIVALSVWYFTCTTLYSYFFDTLNWSQYYLVVYWVTLIGLGVAALYLVRDTQRKALLSTNEL